MIVTCNEDGSITIRAPTARAIRFLLLGLALFIVACMGLSAYHMVHDVIFPVPLIAEPDREEALPWDYFYQLATEQD